jgi:hypothetical protein
MTSRTATRSGSLNFRTDAGGVGNIHPLMQMPGSPPGGRSIEVFPDHPHEG